MWSFLTWNVNLLPKSEQSKILKNTVHAVKIKNVGIEFHNIKDREDFLKLLAKCNAVRINDSEGIVYESQRTDFGIYDRDASINGVRCSKCDQIFYNNECTKRTYVKPYSYNDNGLTDCENFICDICKDKFDVDAEEIRERNRKEKKELKVE